MGCYIESTPRNCRYNSGDQTLYTSNCNNRCKEIRAAAGGRKLLTKGSWCLGEGEMLDSEEGSRPDYRDFSPGA